jgi:polyhydroxybutyrate depolymerase
MPVSNRRVAGLLTALFVLLSLTSFACTKTVSASERPAGTVAPDRTSAAEGTITRLDSLVAGGLTRQYEVIGNGKPLLAIAPVIIMLSGIRATLTQEIPRDDLVPYATAGLAEVVYPVAIGESWNAIGCCSYAAAHKINDLAFLKALVAKLDPKHARPIDLVGYSNGARLAYRVACTTPGEFDAYAMVKGGPMPGCVVRKPASITLLASVDDPEMPYQPGDKGREKIAVTTEVARLHATDKCPAKGTVQRSTDLTLTTWAKCGSGSRLALAVWPDGVHAFPRPPNNVPAASQVIWAFFTKSPVRPLPA